MPLKMLLIIHFDFIIFAFHLKSVSNWNHCSKYINLGKCFLNITIIFILPRHGDPPIFMSQFCHFSVMEHFEETCFPKTLTAVFLHSLGIFKIR